MNFISSRSPCDGISEQSGMFGLNIMRVVTATINKTNARKTSSVDHIIRDTMPRPARKPKKFKSMNSESNVSDAPVMSTPVHPKQRGTTNSFASPGLSPIQYEIDSATHNDNSARSPTESNDFGFGRVKGVKKAVFPIHSDSDIDEEANDIDTDLDEDFEKQEDDEDLYGSPPAELEKIQTSVHEDSSVPRPPRSKPSKSARNPRTSELLPLLPMRRKRKPSYPQKIPSLDSSDSESETNVPIKKKPIRRREVDKENDVPKELQEEVDSEGERHREERRKMIKAKFAEVDRWEMAFETVDVSFSSQ